MRQGSGYLLGLQMELVQSWKGACLSVALFTDCLWSHLVEPLEGGWNDTSSEWGVCDDFAQYMWHASV